MNSKHAAKFLELYVPALLDAYAENPDDYFIDRKYPDAETAIKAFAPRMVESLANGRANNSPTIQRVARKLGIKPTLTAVRAYLNAD